MNNEEYNETLITRWVQIYNVSGYFAINVAGRLMHSKFETGEDAQVWDEYDIGRTNEDGEPIGFDYLCEQIGHVIELESLQWIEGHGGQAYARDSEMRLWAVPLVRYLGEWLLQRDELDNIDAYEVAHADYTYNELAQINAWYIIQQRVHRKRFSLNGIS